MMFFSIITRDSSAYSCISTKPYWKSAQKSQLSVLVTADSLRSDSAKTVLILCFVLNELMLWSPKCIIEFPCSNFEFCIFSCLKTVECEAEVTKTCSHKFNDPV